MPTMEVLLSIFMFISSFLTCFVSTPLIMTLMRKRGITGPDIHKISRPLIPEMGGIAILLGLTVSIGLASFYMGYYTKEMLVFLLTTLIAGIVGVIDDLKTLKPRMKVLMSAIACVPIILSNAYSPRPTLPIVGRVRLTIVYPLLLPLALAVPANAVNMMDVFNGTMVGTCSLVVLALLVSALLFNRWNATILCATLLGSLLAFYYYNRYPARVFAGNVGSFTVGAAIGAVAIIGRLEIIGIVALMPHIMNAFYGLSSIGRLYEHREIEARPTFLLKDGKIAASDNPRAPITLTRIIVAQQPMEEKEAIRVFMILAAFAAFLAVLTAGLMEVMVV